MVYNEKDRIRKWLVYVITAFDGNYKYNFVGTCKDLYTLIGAIYSTWLVKVNDIRYYEAYEEKEYNKDYKTIELIPWKDSYRTYERSNDINE